VIEPGIDHFYAAPDIEVKSVAVANVVAEALLGPVAQFDSHGTERSQREPRIDANEY
jgi:hypothetical protein